MRLVLAAALLALPLAACDDNKPGTSISINAADDDGNTAAHVDGATGTVSLKTPVFSGSLKLPKMHLTADDFDMNGVHLYPGSTISGLNVEAQDNKAGDNDADKDSGIVHVRFESPADPATVRDWFATKLNHAGFSVAPSGNGLAGTTDDKKPFKLDLKPADNGHATGEITING